MSFRRRFFLIIALAVAMLGAAMLALLELRSEGDAQRIQAAIEAGATLVGAVGERAKMRGLDAPDLHADDARLGPLGADLDELLRATPTSSGGLCDAEGHVVIARPQDHHDHHEGPHDEPRDGPHFSPDDRGPPRFDLPPADRALVESACRAAKGASVARDRKALPRDLILTSAARVGPSFVAWSLVRLPPIAAKSPRAPLVVEVSALVTASVVLVWLTLDALLALRRGARALDLSLARLQDDLRAPLPAPRGDELGRIDAGLRAMASRLADARDQEQSLRDALAHEQRLAALGRVVAGVAHEVRNPITGIKLTLDRLGNKPLDDRTRGDVDTCLAEIARLDRLVGALLLVARRSGDARADVDLAALVDARIAAIEGLASTRRVRARRAGRGHRQADADALVRVVDNLLRNAVEASPDGGAVEVVVADDSIAVVDEGDGVDEALVDQLFEPFFTRKPDGTGLGLFVSESLARALGGRLSYARRDGKTWFIVDFATAAPPRVAP